MDLCMVGPFRALLCVGLGILMLGALAIGCGVYAAILMLYYRQR